MFYVHKMQQRILVEPRFLGSNLGETVRKKLLASMEGKCSAEYGYLISILSILSMSPLAVEPLEGDAAFIVEFEALTLLPTKGEVADAVIHEINKMGIFAFVGPLSIFISTYQIPGQLVDAGGEFVIIPNDGSASISRGALLRLRIIGTKVEPAKVFAIGTINDDYLGSIHYIS